MDAQAVSWGAALWLYTVLVVLHLPQPEWRYYRVYAHYATLMKVWWISPSASRAWVTPGVSIRPRKSSEFMTTAAQTGWVGHAFLTRVNRWKLHTERRVILSCHLVYPRHGEGKSKNRRSWFTYRQLHWWEHTVNHPTKIFYLSGSIFNKK